jgi:hypothetical protein
MSITVQTVNPPERVTTPSAASGLKLSGRGPLPLIIGVTGHRLLRPEDMATLERMVSEILTDTAARYPNSPIVVVSPLAEGADRLVARVGLAIGARLVVPLPLPRAIYEHDFETPESRAEFDAMLTAAESQFELPLVKGNTLSGISEQGDQRDRQYAQVGAFVARHSQVFLALWDGVNDADDKHGGTAEIVQFRLDGAPGRYEPAASPLTHSSIGTVTHLVTPRQGQPVPEGALTLRLLVPGRPSDAELSDLPRWMDKFNADAIANEPSLGPARDTSKSWLLQVDVKDVPAQEASLSASARITLEQYSVADSLAVIYATAARGAMKRVYTWVFVAALFFNLFHSLPHHALPEEPTMVDRLLAVPWLLWLFLAASLVGSLWVHARAAKEDFQNKHQDYRALAEALRIQFFWRVAGLPDAVVDHYLRKQRGELEWIRNALRAWDAESMRHHAPGCESATPLADRLAFVGKHWVSEQRNYYTKRARREQHLLESEEHKIGMLVKISVGMAMLLVLVLTVPLFVHVHALEALLHAVEDPWTHGLIMVVVVTLAVAAGLRHGYNEQMAYSEHAKQFGRMSELFDAAERHLARQLGANEHHRAQELLKEVGEEALEENGDWVLLHRERPLEVPHSG